MYKDEHLQKEANKRASQRRRDKIKQQGMTLVPEKGMINQGIVIPDHPVPVIPKRGKDIRCFADPKALPPLTQAQILLSRHGVHCSPSLVCSIPGDTVTGKPGDADYNGICTPEWRAEHGR
jgi:hypothetical protein